MDNEKQKQVTKMEGLERFFATEVIEQSKRTAKRWFAAWVITFVALIISNFVWLYVFQSYDYVSQDGSGVNTYETDINGDLNGAED
ncbi:hypothetical protein [Anaerostipes butyraticus]|uniref:Uncharacterized protein n=1 Tax=Anaerostipes butyraticus TaxID=645466 RepID=A0A916QD46_9FIRM|nr:hypothetical protein [Anaerostipes butyraticus]GFO86463.1 hypothetical protein ANBU17_28100 [Anaerostipes butyraticus]